jgi:hypothetical protein
MSWKIAIDGNEVSSDDLLLDDLAYVEKVGGSPWSIANPYKDIGVARAFLRVALVRSGVSPEDADERMKTITLGDVKTAFTFVEDTPSAGGQQGKSQGRTTSTSRSSSGGARKGSTGPRKKSGSSE